MAELIAIVVVLWLLGIVKMPWLTMPHFPSLNFLGLHLTIQTLLIIAIFVWIASSLGGPFRQIVWVLVVLWILSALGVIVIGGLSNIIVIAIVVGLVLSLVQKN
jgi:hypothetical protein